MRRLILLLISVPFVLCKVQCPDGVDIKDVFWLIPKTQKSCLTADKKGAFRMGSDKVELLRPFTKPDGSTDFSKVIRFPGCFELSAELEVVRKLPSNAVIMYHSFKWLQALSKADVSKLDIGCTGQTPDGCGGTGNRCFYCDVCETMKEQNNELDQKFEGDCPEETGKVYDYYDDRCVNDWGKLDKDCDGTPDFMKEDKYKDYKQFLNDMKVQGYGTMRLTILLAHNATEAQVQVWNRQKQKIQRTADKLLADTGKTTDTELAWNNLHRRFWLPKMIQKNIIACVNVFFDMCKKEPVPDARKLDAFNCVS